MKPKIIDLFCGAGGFSLGSHKAGFQTALGIAGKGVSGRRGDGDVAKAKLRAIEALRRNGIPDHAEAAR